MSEYMEERASRPNYDNEGEYILYSELTAMKDRIAELETLLKKRDRGMHTIGQHDQECPSRYPSGNCICGHDDVAKYFRESGQ